MSRVYVLIVEYPHEFSKVLGVFSELESAEREKTAAEKSDDSNGYDRYSVEEHAVQC